MQTKRSKNVPKVLENQIDNKCYVEALVVSGNDDTVLDLLLFPLWLMLASSLLLHAALAVISEQSLFVCLELE